MNTTYLSIKPGFSCPNPSSHLNPMTALVRQAAVAARIVQKQSGVVTSREKLTSDHLATVLNKVRIDSTYRDYTVRQKSVPK